MEKENYVNYCSSVKQHMVSLLSNGKSGHLGGSLSALELMVVIYNDHIKGTENKLIYSKGHCELLIYSIFIEEDIIERQYIKEYKKFGSPLQGHPNSSWIPELEYSPGSLGQGLSFGIGLAITGLEEGYQVFVLLGDGEMQEGQIWEAALVAKRLKLSNLHVIVDCNGYQLEGKNLSFESIYDMQIVWEKLGWHTVVIDNGHNIEIIKNQLDQAEKSDLPKIYFAKTVKGNGLSFAYNNNDYHGVNLTQAEIEQARIEFDTRGDN